MKIVKSKKYILAGRSMALMIAYIYMSCIFGSCKKNLEINPPNTQLAKSVVFTSDATATAAILDIYYQLSTSGFASGSFSSVSFLSALSSDEIVNYNPGSDFQQFNDNSIVPANSYVTSIWSQPYQCIYKANAILEGLTASAGVSDNIKKQLEGEAKFVRAFCYFYLVNMFGDVPLALTTDYRVNMTLSRAVKAQVYQQIIKDLKEAQGMLVENYSFSNNLRARANKWVATALLARVYLYAEDFSNAELEATKIISNSPTYYLESDLSVVFTKTSKEAILQLENISGYPPDIFQFYLFGKPEYGALRQELVNDFELGDQRKVKWVGSISVSNNTYFFPTKYKSLVSFQEYSTVLRLGEQYLIRAEARAKQNKVTGANSAETDINAIRNRASLSNTSATDQAAMLAVIGRERKRELFTEWGHRWFDLKRTDRANAVIGPIKGANWQPTDMLYPIPESQILNSTIAQNPGY